jgi:uncharacterized coiled-coil protein SlyX
VPAERQATVDAVRQVEARLAEMQNAIDELTVKLAEQQRQLLAANAALDSLTAQLVAVQLDGDTSPPVMPSAMPDLAERVSALLATASAHGVIVSRLPWSKRRSISYMSK